MTEQGSSSRRMRRLALTGCVLAISIAAAPTTQAKPGGVPADPPHGNPPAHSQGNPGAADNNGANGNRGNANGRKHGASGQSSGQGIGRQGTGHDNGRRSHGAPANREAGSHDNGRRSHGAPAATSKPKKSKGGNDSAGGQRGSSEESPKGNARGRGNAHQKTTLCHATGSDTNPYVEITISNRAVKAHARHQDGEDIIPAPAGGCPGPASASAPEVVGTALGTVLGLGDEPAPQPSSTAPAAGEEAAPGDGPTVLGVSEGRDAPATEPAAATAAETGGSDDDDSGSLPFTGLELVLLVAIGAALLLAGLTIRRLRATRAL